MEKIWFLNPMFRMTLLDAFYFFTFWAVFGWAMEVVVRTIESGKFENRGFLNGPYCPIYGFGVLGIRLLFAPMSIPLLLFIGCMAFCTGLEWLVGVILEKVFHTQCWNYRDYYGDKVRFCSTDGYVCLKISILWGLGSMVVLAYICPRVEMLIHHIPPRPGNYIAIAIFALYMFDLAMSIAQIAKLNTKIDSLNSLYRKLYDISNTIGEKISDGTIFVLNEKDKISDKLSDQRDKISDKLEKWQDDVSKIKEDISRISKEVQNSRIIRAFPAIRSSKYHYIKISNLTDMQTFAKKLIRLRKIRSSSYSKKEIDFNEIFNEDNPDSCENIPDNCSSCNNYNEDD